MTAKLSVLRACKRVLRPHSRLAFFTITVAPGLSKQAHRRAVRAGPPAVGARRDSHSLLRQAGFAQVSESDVTPEYAVTAKAWYDVADRLRDELRPIDPVLFDEQQRDRRRMLAAVEDGLLRRSLLVATSGAGKAMKRRSS